MFYQYRDKKVNLNIFTMVFVCLLLLSVPATAQIFSDAQGWGYPQYYLTIRTADIDGDGADELLGRGGAGIETYDFNAGGNPWEPLPVTNTVWPDVNGWGNPAYYSTIQTADVDGDGDAELIGRGANGIETYDFNTTSNSWELLAWDEICSDAQGWGYPQYYLTICTADIDGDGAEELLGRGGAGIETYDFNTSIDSWERLSVSNTVWPDAWGWANQQYYETIRTADIDGDGDAELIGRGANGIETYDFNTDTNFWELRENGNPPWKDTWGWGNPAYYRTIQTADFDRDGRAELMGRAVWGIIVHDYDPTLDCKDVTVLTYNTHLFEDTLVATYAPDNYFQDTTRRHRIATKIREEGADIVALQEVWAPENQQYFINILNDVYPYGAAVDSTCGSYIFGLDTLGNGLVLLSKWPLSDVKFERFPTYDYSSTPGNYDSWANKGALTATAITGSPLQQRPVRIGISHALTGGQDQKGEMSRHHVDIIPFELNGRPYIFGLHVDGYVNIWRIDDSGTSYNSEKGILYYGAGKQLVHSGAVMDPGYKFIRSFHLKEGSEGKKHPYIFGLRLGGGADIWRINDDPSTGFQKKIQGASMSGNYVAVVTFELDGAPYIWGLHRDVGANIWRIDYNSSTGDITRPLVCESCPGGPSGSDYDMDAVHSFYLNGDPYIFGLHNSVGPNIWSINYISIFGVKYFYMTLQCSTCAGGPTSVYYHLMTSFQLDGQPYIFGLHENGHASIWRINDPPNTGMTLVTDRQPWSSNYRFIKSFPMNGHPYLFALKNCCEDVKDALGNDIDDCCGRDRPGEAYITRINDDPASDNGWQEAYQMEDIRIIAEKTIDNYDYPAIFAGDFNVHRSRYDMMDTIFRQAGAADAYTKVNDTAEGGETIDLFYNTLDRYFRGIGYWDPLDPSVYPKESSFDRIDYVYVRQTGVDYKLVPTEAYVIRDWTYYDSDNGVHRDLSDHYPVVVKFEMRHRRDINNDCSINLFDFSLLAAAWMIQSSDENWDPYRDISDPPDNMINIADLRALAEYWLTTPIIK